MLCPKPLDVLTALENQISETSRMVSVIALVIKFKEIILSKFNQCDIRKKVKSAILFNTSLLQEGKSKLVKMINIKALRMNPVVIIFEKLQ